MIPQAYREAHNGLDLALSNLRGLAHALWRVTFESTAVDASSQDGTSITVLTSMLAAEIEKAEALNMKAWDAVGAAHGQEVAA